jgi:chitinase
MSRNRRATGRITLALLGLLMLAIFIPASVTRSGATFVAASANPGAQFTAAADFNTVAVVLTNPGSPLKGFVVVSATAASDRGITSVVFSSAPAGTSTWTVACTKTVPPYTCTFDTTTVTDGLVDVRAVATDSAGYSRTDTVTNRRVDNTAPIAATTDPGSPLTGTVTVAGTAADGGSGLASVSLEYRSTTGSWTNLCTQATSPISCAWNTTSLADGLWDLRTVATDVAGNQTISAPVFNRRVDNTAPTVSLTDPGTPLKGTITLASTTGDGAGSGVSSVLYQYKLAAGAWTTACTSATTPFSCTFNTGSVADGLYDFRAIATDGVAKVTTSAVVTARRIDNTAPATAVLGTLPTPLQNTVAMTATATDLGSGVASVTFQYAPTGTTTWSDICTDASFAYTCSFDTTSVTDGVYDLRALAIDGAGNTLASPTQTRTLDNNGPTLTLTNPTGGSSVRGTVSVDASATDVSGVASVAVQYRVVGAATWTTLCTDASSPYSCPLNTTTLVSGASYEIRLTGTDTLAKSTTTLPVTVTVDNIAPTGANVQGTNGGTAGVLDAGDALTVTFSEPMLPVSILAGWDGAATPVTVHINNAGSSDTLDIYNAANTTKANLTGASLELDEDCVSTNATFNATMRHVGSDVTVTFGALTSGSRLTGVRKGRLVWTPSTSATDLAGNAGSGTAVTELGGNDQDF